MPEPVSIPDFGDESKPLDVPACEETVEHEIQRKGLTAPRVTPADIDAAIAAEFYTTLHKALGEVPQFESFKLTTLCVLVCRNGFTIIGKSACASPENFDEALGQRIARQDAVNQLWPLLGYELKTNLLFNAVAAAQAREDAAEG